ncbi:MAG: hypothetical protein ACFFBI_02835 [Promethearchaeota archaeon]
MKDDNIPSFREKNNEEKIEFLKKKLRILETEKQSLNAELQRLREPPLVTAIIVGVNEEKGRATIISSTGSMFVVNISRKVRNQKLESGMFVGLNQRTFAIMEILSITEEEVRFAKSKIYKQ